MFVYSVCRTHTTQLNEVSRDLGPIQCRRLAQSIPDANVGNHYNLANMNKNPTKRIHFLFFVVVFIQRFAMNFLIPIEKSREQVEKKMLPQNAIEIMKLAQPLLYLLECNEFFNDF